MSKTVVEKVGACGVVGLCHRIHLFRHVRLVRLLVTCGLDHGLGKVVWDVSVCFALGNVEVLVLEWGYWHCQMEVFLIFCLGFVSCPGLTS